MTDDARADQSLMPPIFYRVLCAAFGSIAFIAILLTALKPATFDPVATLPGAVATGWFAWMCYVAGWPQNN
jgi:hypothetical protein